MRHLQKFEHYDLPPPEDINQLLSAIKDSNLEQVKNLLANGVDPSDYNNEAIKNAAYYGNIEIFKLILADPRVHPTNHGYTSLEYSDTEDEYTALGMAAQEGHPEIVELLLADPRMPAPDPKNIKTWYRDPRHFAINAAVQSRHDLIAKTILNDQKLCAVPFFAVTAAIIKQNSSILKRLLNHPKLDKLKLIDYIKYEVKIYDLNSIKGYSSELDTIIDTQNKFDLI